MPTQPGAPMEGHAEKRMFPLVASEYKILEEIGQGVSASVYRAHCATFNEVVAIKSLDLEKCNSNLDDIRREAITMSLISHQNVVKAYCSFVVDQSLWVVMPYMSGGSCLHIMKAAYPDGFDEPVIATVLKESLKALEYLHRHGHIHRDVKAGNILVDANGAVKLGDFGVSACMFDTGDRQRARNTFCGTPCWMAPEVMEQLHGYDFKADIWSFGITALELAHGHAPFSKYPPMKVLLMTLQNAPPGLDYERDKRFSKSFKEMIAMCLVKDPAKRPNAEKLLRHSFFRQARSFDYIARHVLDGLPPLGERVKNLKITDANLLAQKKMPYDEQEVQSQYIVCLHKGPSVVTLAPEVIVFALTEVLPQKNEYKRGVSSWNFNVEDLKAQAALIQDDNETSLTKTLKEVTMVKEVEEVPKAPGTLGSDESGDASPQLLCPSPQPSLTRDTSSDRFQVPVTIHSIIAETTMDAGERVTRGRSGPLPNPVQPKSANGPKSGPSSGRKEPKHIGRFDVFEDDNDLDSPGRHGSPREHWKAEDREQPKREREEKEHRKTEDRDRREEKEQRRVEDRSDRDDIRRVSSATLGPERVQSSLRSFPSDERDRDRDKEHRQSGRTEDVFRTLHRDHSCSGPLTAGADRAVQDIRPGNGVQGAPRPTSGNKEAIEEKMKAPAQKPVVQKGRFSVTTGDGDLEDPPHASSRRSTNAQTASLHKSASVGDWSIERRHPVLQHQSSLAPPTTPTHQTISASAPNAALIPYLQQILQHGQKQQEAILNLISCLSANDATTLQSLNSINKYSRSSSLNSAVDVSQVEVSSDRERELLHQFSELQSRMANLVDELQTVKLRNVLLERQLNAIYNKEEEERIRKEEAAKEDG